MSSDQQGRPRRRPAKQEPRTRKRWPLDDDAVERVRHLIRNWSGSALTWDALLVELARGGRGAWSRQALSGNAKISDAYRKRKVELADAKGKPQRPRDMVADLAAQQVDVLKARIADLEALLALYEQRFATIIHNASVRGFSQQELEQPLQSIDRRAIRG